ncbi:hypothetical protein LWI29_009646 [Acer saccharum]|uniref:Uncharacterized protein n=1 Tax=Acer saccharum TaxID=4024 RepID=A0AA39VAV0_ACESA|nr:hypothetical protein LWI29_009646 [Acer saccharum]
MDLKWSTVKTVTQNTLKMVRKECKQGLRRFPKGNRLRRYFDSESCNPPVQSPPLDDDDDINRRVEIFISKFRRHLSLERQMFP